MSGFLFLKFMAHSTTRATFVFLYLQELALNWWFADVVIRSRKVSLPWIFWACYIVGISLETILTILEFWGCVNFFFRREIEAEKDENRAKMLPRNSEASMRRQIHETLILKRKTMEKDETMLSTRIWLLKTLKMIGIMPIIIRPYEYLPVGIMQESCVITFKLWFGFGLLTFMLIRLISLRHLRMRSDGSSSLYCFTACRLKPLCFVFSLLLTVNLVLYIQYFAVNNRYLPSVLYNTPCYPAAGKFQEELKLQPMQIHASFGRKADISISDWQVAHSNRSSLELKRKSYNASIFVAEHKYLLPIYARIISSQRPSIIPVSNVTVWHLANSDSLELMYKLQKGTQGSEKRSHFCKILLKYHQKTGQIAYNFQFGELVERDPSTSWDPTKCFIPEFIETNHRWSKKLLEETIREFCPGFTEPNLDVKNLFSRKLEVIRDNPWCHSECDSCKFVSVDKNGPVFTVQPNPDCPNLIRGCKYSVAAVPNTLQVQDSIALGNNTVLRDFTITPFTEEAPCPSGVLAEQTTFNVTANQRRPTKDQPIRACAFARLQDTSSCSSGATKTRCRLRFDQASDQFSVSEHVDVTISSCLKARTVHDPDMYVSTGDGYLKCQLGQEYL